MKIIKLILSIIAISSTSLALEFDELDLSTSKKIGLYTGSFDPFHQGHDEAVHYALNHCELDYVIVIPDRKENIYKTSRIAYDIRIEAIKEIFRGSANVVIAELELIAVISRFRASTENHYLLRILGSDNVIRMMTQGKTIDPAIVAVLAICRDGETSLDQVSTIGGTPLVISKREFLFLQNSSSSKTKKFLFEHPEFYENIDYQPSFEELPLCPVSREFIRLRGLYQNQTYFIIKGVRAFLEQQAEFRGANFEIKTANEFGKPSLSEELVLFVLMIKEETDSRLIKELAIVIKVYKGDHKDQRFSSEIDSYEFFRQLGLTLSSTPNISIIKQTINIAPINTSEKFISILGFSVAKGCTLADLLGQYSALEVEDEEERSLIFSHVKAASFSIGASLAELHSHTKSKNTSETNLDFWKEKLINKIQNLSISSEQKFENIREAERLYQSFIQKPGKCGWTHGDASISNFFYDKNALLNNSASVSMIDISTLIESRDTENKAIGQPAFEYYQFISSISWFCNKHELALIDSELEEIQNSFDSGYQQFNLHNRIRVSEPAKKFFKFYWEIKSLEDKFFRLI